MIISVETDVETGGLSACLRRRSQIAIRLAVLLLLTAAASPGRAQTGGTNTPSPPDQASQQSDQTVPQKQSSRVAGIIPAFNAENDVNAPALSDSDKFHLFVRTVKDPYNLVMPAVNALILSGAGASSGYGGGFTGFAKKYGASIADSVSGNFFRLYAFPVLLHEDPRYFRAGQGSIGQRTRHVFGATVRTRTNAGSFRFNWSKLLASTCSSALSNAYYPAENRGAKLILSRIGLSYIGEIAMNGLKEFWPDIAHKK